MLTKWDNVDSQNNSNNNSEPARKQFQPQQPQQLKSKPNFRKSDQSNVSAITKANKTHHNEKQCRKSNVNNTSSKNVYIASGLYLSLIHIYYGS